MTSPISPSPEQSPYGQPLAPGAALPIAKPKRPLWKRWWVWLIAVLLVLIIAFAIALANTRADGFKDEAEKDLAWEVYRCETYGELTAGPVGMQILMDILNDKIPSDQVADARQVAAKLNRGGNDKTVGNYMDYKDTKNASNLCSGWLWDYLKDGDNYWTGYDEFTYNKAKDAGVFG